MGKTGFEKHVSLKFSRLKCSWWIIDFVLRSAPNPYKLPFIFNLNGKFRFEIFRIGADSWHNQIHSDFLWFLQMKNKVLLKSAPSGVVTSARFGMNFWDNLPFPKFLRFSKRLKHRHFCYLISLLRQHVPKHSLRSWYLFLLSFDLFSVTLSKTYWR